jgi:hypothetical protein
LAPAERKNAGFSRAAAMACRLESVALPQDHSKGGDVMRGMLLWLAGVPLSVIVLLWIIGVLR